MLVTPMQNLNIQDKEGETSRPNKHYLQLPSLQTVLETPYVNTNNNRPTRSCSRNLFNPDIKTMQSNKQTTFPYNGNTLLPSLNSTMMESESIPTDCRCPTDYSSQKDTNINHRVAMRKGLKLNCPPNITIYTPDGNEVSPSNEKNNGLDNEEFLSTVTQHSPITSPSFEKHEVHSGRLFLIRHNGSGLNSPDSPSSPSTPTRPLMSAFPFRSQSPLAVSPGSKVREFSPKSPTKPKRNKVVFVRVYRCYNDHFATISRDCLYTAKSIYINIRRCKLIPGNTLGRFILAGKMDSGDLIEFEAMEISALNQWLDAFQTLTPPPSPGQCMSGLRSPIIPGSPHMPALAETDEEDHNW